MLIMIYSADLGGPARAAVVRGCCRVALFGGRGQVRQCSRRYTVMKTTEDGVHVGMCTQHASAWDEYQATKRRPK